MVRMLLMAGMTMGFLALTALAAAQNNPADGKALAKLDARVYSDGEKAQWLGQMVWQDVNGRLQSANQRHAKAFEAVASRADWDRFRSARLDALREALGPFPAVPPNLKTQITGTIEGDGVRVEKVVFASRPGLVVTANLYRPEQPAKSMPGIILVHSFHHPKHQAELQDMGVNWARQGCLVLVPDLIGHGERRQHPFTDAKSYPGKFNLPRQDYYSRANLGIQLYLAGENLTGWMVWDLMCCADVLRSQAGIDPERILILGAVAGGGDLAAIAAALDPRIAAVATFNFGGPEPETGYPLPADAEKIYPYAKSDQWDATRRLPRSAQAGFVPWVIVGSMAPRRVIYAHEFAWDEKNDPVWPRLKKVYDLCGVPTHLTAVQGRGTLQNETKDSTGCANIGAALREPMYPILKRWFDISVPAKEVQQRRSTEDLHALTPQAVAAFQPRAVHELASRLAAEHIAQARQRLAEMKPADRVAACQRNWARLLGDIEPRGIAKVSVHHQEKQGVLAIERIALEVEPGVVVPLVLLLPARPAGQRVPVVVGLAQDGKQEFLKQRADGVAQLLGAGVAVCLPDVRGTGETRPPGDLRGPPAGSRKDVLARSASTPLAAGEVMLGQTLLGNRLRDVRSVLRYLESRSELDSSRLGLWGDSFATTNAADAQLQVPWDAEKVPQQSEPLGGLLALLTALFEDKVASVAIRGSLLSYHSILDDRFCYVPHDVIVPGALTAGDLADLAGVLAPRPLRMVGLVDGRNRPASSQELATAYATARTAYRDAGKADRFLIEAEDGKRSTSQWLLEHLTQK